MPLTPGNLWTSLIEAMETFWVLLLYFSIAFSSTTLAIPSDAGIFSRRLKLNIHRHGISGSLASDSKMKLQRQEGLVSKPQMKYFTTVNSPFSLPPFDSLAPTPLPKNSSPFCENAPPQTPHLPSPPSQPNVPTRSLSPPPPTPHSIIPITPFGPLTPISPLVPYGPPSPPQHYGPPTPPKHASGPPSYGLSPPILVFPPPSGPPPASSHGGKPRSSGAVWCVAKPTVSDPIIQQALDYACGSGADCKPIQPSGHCYKPDTVLAHASYAFNSYWQNTKVIGGTCDFGGTAMLVTVDPSFEGCKFILN